MSGVPQGDVGVPQGNVGVPQGDVGVPQGDVGVPQGNVGVPRGNVGVPRGDVGVPRGNVGVPRGDVGVPRGDVGVPRGMAGVPRGMAGVPQGDVGAPRGDVGVPRGDVGVPQGDVGAPRGDVGVPRGMAGVPQGDVGAPRGNVGVPQGNVGVPQGNVGAPQGDVGAPRGDVGVPRGMAGVPRGDVGALAPGALVALLEDGLEVVLIDCRPFADFNSAHILEAVNVIGSRLVRRRIQQERLQVEELLGGVARRKLEAEPVVVVYDQSSVDPGALAPDSFLSVLLLRLRRCVPSVHLLAGGFSHFSLLFPALCETKSAPGPSPPQPGPSPPQPGPALMQPGPAPTTTGPTRILPHLYLGCQRDVLNKEVMDENFISFVLNVSRSCPQPDFIPSSRFLRVPVNDSFSDKILPWLDQSLDFIEAAKASDSRVLIHCLAGISRSATIAIAYIMKRRSLSLDEAYRFVKALRPSISPNFNFLGQLLDFEKKIKSSENSRGAGPSTGPAPLEPLTLPCVLADAPEERRLARALSGLKLTRNPEASEDQDLKDQDLKDQDSEDPKDQDLKDQDLKDQDLEDQDLKDQDLEDQDLKDQDLKDQDLKDQDLKDQDLKDQDLKDQDLKDQDLKDQDLKDQDLKDQDLKDQDSEDPKDQDLKDQDLKDQDLEDQDLKDQDLEDQDLKDQDLKDQDLKDQDLKDQDLKDQDLEDQDLKDQDLKDQDLKDQDLKDQDLKASEDPEDPEDPEDVTRHRHSFSLDIGSHSEVAGSSTHWPLDSAHRGGGSALRPGDPWQFSPVPELSERFTPEQSPDKEEADAPLRAPPHKLLPRPHPDNGARFLLGLSRSTQQLAAADPASALKGWNSDLLLGPVTAAWLRPHDTPRLLNASPFLSLEAVQRRGRRAESSRRASRSSWHEESSFEKTLKRRSCRTEDDLHSSGSMEVIQVS